MSQPGAILLLLAVLALGASAAADTGGPVGSNASTITDTSMQWPSTAEIGRVLLLRDYNTRLVVLSTALLGFASGLVGTLLLLRKRSLMGDALSHATLPGIALAFMVMVAAGGTGKFLPGLLLGGVVFGMLGVGCVLLITNFTRLKDDAALGIVLSVFFGLGVALLGIAQQMPSGSAAGLQQFIYGKTASIIRSDLLLIASAAAVVAVACGLLYKEFKLLCFDADYAAAQGWPVTVLDVLMMTLVAAVTVIGLQAVGLILIIALLITPPAAARFWTDQLGPLMIVSAVIGAIGGWLGASLSALVPRLPAGAIIVLVCAACFLVSMLLGRTRGVLVLLVRQWGVVRRIRQQHLLRAVYERLELAGGDVSATVSSAQLLPARSWSPRQLRRLLRWAEKAGLAAPAGGQRYQLTDAGRVEAERLARNHRLWEIYLVTYADIAPSHVDRDADQIEHVLAPELVAELERLLGAETHVPPSPHALEAG